MHQTGDTVVYGGARGGSKKVIIIGYEDSYFHHQWKLLALDECVKPKVVEPLKPTKKWPYWRVKDRW